MQLTSGENGFEARIPDSGTDTGRCVGEVLTEVSPRARTGISGVVERIARS